MLSLNRHIKMIDGLRALACLLRRTNIDELPQLLNVLFGEMSIVGPRPHAIVHNEMLMDSMRPLARRHVVKPGIAGWAQQKRTVIAEKQIRSRRCGAAWNTISTTSITGRSRLISK